MPTTTTTENCTYHPIVDNGESLELWAKRRNQSCSRDLSQPTVSPPLEVPGDCEWDLSTACPMQMDSVHHKQCDELRVLYDGDVPGLANTINTLFPNNIPRLWNQDTSATWHWDRCSCLLWHRLPAIADNDEPEWTDMSCQDNLIGLTNQDAPGIGGSQSQRGLNQEQWGNDRVSNENKRDKELTNQRRPGRLFKRLFSRNRHS